MRSLVVAWAVDSDGADVRIGDIGASGQRGFGPDDE